MVASSFVLSTWFGVVAMMMKTQVYGSMVSTDPFPNDEQHQLFVPSFWQDEIDVSIGLHPTETSLFWSLKQYSVALWFDNMAAITEKEYLLAEAECYAQETGINYIVPIVIYDLPNRDCSAAASNGEISCDGDYDCVDGLNIYKTSYIDEIYNVLAKYPSLRYIAVIEPDSLPNLATNLGVSKCAEGEIAYETGIAYAIEKLSFLDNIAIYIDAGHSGWLGWQGNQDGYANIMGDVFTIATESIINKYTTVRIDGVDVTIDVNTFNAALLIRGFISNVSGYQALGCLYNCEDVDPCGHSQQWNPAYNEILFANQLMNDIVSITNINGISKYHWIVDTSRNGNEDSRISCSNWCNINNAGIGNRPTFSNDIIESYTEYSDVIDALLWIKIPGESDGTSDTTADRYDSMCSSQDSFENAPEAGQWFDAFFVSLVENANPEIEQVNGKDRAPAYGQSKCFEHGSDSSDSSDDGGR